jgi:peptidylprolyl isomerase
MQAGTGDTVAVHYEGRLEDGTVFDRSEPEAPLLFTIGSGDLLPAFEQAVIGLAVGESATVTIPPEDAYGPYVEGTRQLVPVDLFGEGEPPVDAYFTVIGDDEQEYTGRVVEITEDRVNVLVDFNHPLAGHALTFDITLEDIHDSEQ